MNENYVLVGILTDCGEVFVQSFWQEPNRGITDIVIDFIKELPSREGLGKPIAYAAEGGFTADGLSEKMDKFIREKFPVMVTL